MFRAPRGLSTFVTRIASIQSVVRHRGHLPPRRTGRVARPPAIIVWAWAAGLRAGEPQSKPPDRPRCKLGGVCPEHRAGPAAPTESSGPRGWPGLLTYRPRPRVDLGGQAYPRDLHRAPTFQRCDAHFSAAEALGRSVDRARAFCPLRTVRLSFLRPFSSPFRSVGELDRFAPDHGAGGVRLGLRDAARPHRLPLLECSAAAKSRSGPPARDARHRWSTTQVRKG